MKFVEPQFFKYCLLRKFRRLFRNAFKMLDKKRNWELISYQVLLTNAIVQLK